MKVRIKKIVLIIIIFILLITNGIIIGGRTLVYIKIWHLNYCNNTYFISNQKDISVGKEYIRCLNLPFCRFLFEHIK